MRAVTLLALLACLLLCCAAQTTTTTASPNTTTTTAVPTTSASSTTTAAPIGSTTPAPVVATTTAAPVSPGTPSPGETPAPTGFFGASDYTETQKFGISCATFACLAAGWALFCFAYGKVADRCDPEADKPKYAQVPQANAI